MDKKPNYKRELWEMISTKDPALKQLLEEVRKTFGKPESVKVTFKQE